MKNNLNIEIKTGDIVEISDAFFKNDNGLYFVEHSPGDPDWMGKDYCLKRVLKSGKIARSGNTTCFWPLMCFVNSKERTTEANEWNKAHAKIEAASVRSLDFIINHFQNQSMQMDRFIEEDIRYFREDSPKSQRDIAMKQHYESVVASLKQKSGES